MPIALLFTGHMVDLPDRKKPRFPQSLVLAARDAIGRALDRHAEGHDALGFASLARGGDILFHEECRKRGIETFIVLPFAPEAFLDTSVRGIPGADWETRFWALWQGTPAARREMLGLPQTDAAYKACNDYMLKRARAYGRLHFIALLEDDIGPRAGKFETGGSADFASEAAHLANVLDIIAPSDLRE